MIWHWAFVLGVILLFRSGVLVGHAEEPQQKEIRVDTFDDRSNRTGHVIIDPRTGRFDVYDALSNRRSTGTISPPPAQNGGRVPSTIRTQPLGGGKR